jgi:putative colanic acid biosynthesis acetyltransferase WcaF
MDMEIDLTQSKTKWPMRVLLGRGIWTWIIEPVVRRLPKACSPLRVAALRMMGASIGPRCLIMPGVKVLIPWNLRLADHVVLGENANIYNFALIAIERMTVISQLTFLCTGSHDYTQKSMPLVSKPIRIGSNCWIAAGVFVAPGVSIPDGAVIGAMSVVTRSPAMAYAVYAGNPCRYLKKRQIDPAGNS